MKTNKVFLLVIGLFVSVNHSFGQEESLSQKWRFGTAVSGGCIITDIDFANDINNYANCIWELNLDYNRIQTSFYSQAGWNSKDNLFDYGLRAGYNIVDGNLLQVTPLVGLGIMNFYHDSSCKNIITPSVGANLDFKLWNNNKTKKNDIWMIRIRYNCLMPSIDRNIITIHSVTIGVAVKGTLFKN